MIPGYNPALNNLLPRHQYPDSILVNKNIFAIFANWIDKRKGIPIGPYDVLIAASALAAKETLVE